MDFSALFEVFLGGRWYTFDARHNCRRIGRVLLRADVMPPMSHGPVLLIKAGIVKGCQMTSFPSIKNDLQNAGADGVDREVVSDQGLITSRKPDDIPAFNKKMIEEFEQRVHPAGIGQRH